MNETIDEDIIAEDRGTIQDGRSAAVNNRAKIIVGSAGLAVAGYLLWTVLFPAAPTKEVKTARPETIKQVEQLNEAAPAPLELAPPPIQAVQLPTPGLPPVDETPDPLLIAAQRAPVLAFSASSGSSSHNGTDNTFADISDQPDRDSQKFSNLMKPTVVEGAKTGHLGNRNMIIAMGTSIPCILETALNSDQPGFTSCIISRDILSDNGRVVLLDKETQIVGEYRGGLQKGQSRLFVLWTRAKTPNGVIVQLASPATDALGRAGFDGHVNKHWWERFGSALLLSVVGDVTRYAVDELSDKNSIQIQDTSNFGKEAASIALENQINIPATLEKHQGEMVNIFVARDLDFSSVYRLAVTENSKKVHERATTGNFLP